MGPKTVLGFCGELHPDILRAMDVSGPIACFEIIVDALPPPKARATKARPKLVLSDLMPVERDFAFLVDRGVPAADLVTAARSADRGLVSGVAVFDVYQGQGVPESKKSVALSVTLQPIDRTLTDADIERVSASIVDGVAKRTGATLRT
jgi:phenylalanyl-tRNA synthetase beta chain